METSRQVVSCVLYAQNKDDKTVDALTQKYIQEERKTCIKPKKN